MKTQDETIQGEGVVGFNKSSKRLSQMHTLLMAEHSSNTDGSSAGQTDICQPQQSQDILPKGMYIGYKTYMDCLKKKATAKFKEGRVSRNVFRNIVIDGMRFNGVIGYSEPYLRYVPPPSIFWLDGYVKLGYGTEIRYEIPIIGPKKAGWYICYQFSAQINIDHLSDEGRHTLAYQFGIPIKLRSDDFLEVDQTNFDFIGERRSMPDHNILFFMSPSYKSIVDWAKKHTRKMKIVENREYDFKGWVKAAVEGVFTPNRRYWQGPAIKAE